MIRRFAVPGQPVAKARARVCRNGHAYTPKKTAQAENRVALAYRCAYIGADMIGDPVTLICHCYFEMPKSWPEKKKAANESQPHTQTPDLDNLTKLVKDALNGIAWNDDAQVWASSQTKTWVRDNPRTEIEIHWGQT